MAIMGPSGCGKTTLLKIIANLIKADEGSVKTSLEKIRMGFVFQSPSNFIFPWMTNYENLVLPLRLDGIKEKQIRTRVRELFETFDISLPMSAYPYQISGGQQQLLVILRALINKPNLLLLDEPFTSLDYLTKIKVMNELSGIVRKNKTLTILISHTIDEAMVFADEVVLLSEKPIRVLTKFKTNFKRYDLRVMKSKKFIETKGKILRFYK